jgi:hypothetical protein
MTIIVPIHLQDAAELLSEEGFKVSNTWYHGTSSGLISAIMEDGLKPSGDQDSISKSADAMKTLGVDYQGAPEPLFLTQSKALAYFWAQKKCTQRNQLFTAQEEPEVISIELEDEFLSAIKPDVGAMMKLISASDDYLDFLGEIYTQCGQKSPIEALRADPMSVDRAVYVKQLGLAYSKQGIVSDCLTVLAKS